MATLTFVYSDSTAVVGPLATVPEPHSWDLCVRHAGRVTAPRGWELVRHSGPLPAVHPEDDDLVALADAVRERGGEQEMAQAGGWYPQPGTPPRGAAESGASAGASGEGLLAQSGSRAGGGRRRGHLRVLPDPSD